MTRYPIGLVRRLDRQMAVLEAGESLLAYQRVGMGSGMFKKEDAASIRRDWLQTAGIRTGQPLVSLASPGEMAALGIKVIEVPPK